MSVPILKMAVFYGIILLAGLAVAIKRSIRK